MLMNKKQLKFPLHTREACLREAMQISQNVWCEVLDPTIGSMTREPTDKTPEQVLRMGLDDRNTAYRFIERDPHPFDGELYKDGYFDCAVCTMNPRSADYFLWIKLTLEQGEQLIEKYGLYESKY